MDSARQNEKNTELAPWRIAALTGGVIAALFAFYLFYLRPWLGWSTRADAWLDQRHCLFAQLCPAQLPLPNQLGVLAVLLAFVLFVVSLWPNGRSKRPAEPVTPWRVIAVTLLAMLGTASIGVQAVQALSADQTPSPGLWFIGILAFGSIAVLWDVYSAPSPPNLGGTRGLSQASPKIGGRGAENQASIQDWGGGGIERVGLSAFDFVLMLGLTLLALGLGLLHIDSWRYAFIGDEWGFYDLATTLIHRPELHSLFSVGDVNAYHTIFSSMLQANVMQLAGENIYGWRLSSLLPMVLSVPAIYVFAHWLSGRMAAAVAGGLLAASHMLLTFSMVAYNNTQALLPVSFALAFFTLAHRRDSAVRYYLLGAALGSTFLVFGLARLVLLPIGVLVLFFYWTSLRRAIKSTVFIALGGLAVATPLLFNLDNWRGLLKATPAQSEAVEKGYTLGVQLMRNVLAGFTAFLVNEHNTHFVVGPHVDPLTAILVLIGLAATVLAWRRRRSLAWLIASLVFWLAVSAIQQYAWVSTTRMFVLVPIYAVYAGVGASALAAIFLADVSLDSERRRQIFFAAGLIVLGVVLNQVHIVRVSHAQSRIRAESLLVREFQRTASVDGSGIPVYVVWSQPDTLRENMILSAYDIDPDRVRFITAGEALSLPGLCDDSRPQMLLLHADAPDWQAIDSHIANCWPAHEEIRLRDDSDGVRLRRYSTLPGLHEVIQPDGEEASSRQRSEGLTAPNPIDVAIDGAGQRFVLSSEPPAIWHFDADGQLVSRLPLVQAQPSALTVADDGLLLVADASPSASLTWYDLDGRVVRSLATAGALGVPVALAAGEGAEVYVADAAMGQVSRMDESGRVLSVLTGGGELVEPVSLSTGSDGALWVLDRRMGAWFKISPEDEVMARLPAGPVSADGAPQLIETGDGPVLISQQDKRRIASFDVDGNLLDILSTLQHPSAMAIDEAGRIAVVENELDRVIILPPSAMRGVENSATVRAEPSADDGGGMVDGDKRQSQFMSPLSPLPLAQTLPDSAAVSQSLFHMADEGNGISRPRAVATGVDPASGRSYVYVGDAAGGGLVAISPEDGTHNLAERASPPLQELSDIAVDSDGNVYALDSMTGHVQRFAADGTYVDAVSSDRGFIGDARGLDVDAQGDIWVADTRGGDIVKLHPDGRILSRTAVMPGQHSQPVDVAVNAQGNLYVVEARTARLLHLTPEGTLLGAWALSPFNSADAAHVALDNNGNLYITQPEQGLVLVLTPDGELSGAWPINTGSRTGRAKPVGIAVDEQGIVWVADIDGNTIVALSE